ncbi:hypothetical protein ACLB2K_068457 [Fragaria x ananassa]
MDTPRYSLIEETEALMVAPNGGDPFQKNAHFLKPVVPSSIDEPPFKLSHCFTSLPSHFDPRLKLEFHGWPHPHKHWTTWVAQMATTHQHTWKQAGIYEAIFNSTYDIKRMNSLVFGFGEKWCCETNTFMFPWGEATFTLEDVMVLGGYSVLGDSVLKPLENPGKELEEKLDRERKEIYNTGSRKATTSLWLNRFMGSGSEIEHQAFLAYWLCRYVFHGAFKSIQKHVFSIAVHLARGTGIALAPAVLASIYRDLSLLKNAIVESNELNATTNDDHVLKLNLKSPFQLVQVWGWERFLDIRPKPNVIRYAEPRMARWDKVKGLNVENLSTVLDSAGEGFLWRPYAIAVENWKLPKYYADKEERVLVGPGLDDELLSFAVCLQVIQLVGLGTKQLYLPHRVAMQFGYDQDLPCSVGQLSHSSENVKLYIPSRLSEANASARFLKWWKASVMVEHESSPPKKKTKKTAVGSKKMDKITDATLPCVYSPTNSDELVQLFFRPLFL